MKRMIVILALAAVLLGIAFFAGAVGTKEEKKAEPHQETGYEIAMIADHTIADDGSFVQSTWKSIQAFAEERGLTAKCYEPAEAQQEAYLNSVRDAAENEAELIVMAGSGFETVAYDAQKEFPDVYFLLLDGVPHDQEENYAVEGNAIGIIFAEEEAGYLAGYAAVKDGYQSLGFLGGKAIPAVKRYGYGFVQGASDAAAQMQTKVKVRYQYADTLEPSEEVEQLAAEWYEGGTEVIFACGGTMGRSVIKTAETKNGKVIGVDVDQSYLSPAVITSAKKDIGKAVTDVLKNYAGGRFVGGTAFTYAAKNDGISLELDNAQFQAFTKEEYETVFNQLKKGEIELKKDTDVKNLSEFEEEWIKLE